MTPRLAFIGMGPIGQAMSRRLVDYGHLDHDLLLYNRTFEVAQDHARNIGGAKAVQSLADLISQSDIIWSCLANDTAVLETYTSITAEPLKGKLFVECSTIEAETIEKFVGKLERAGAEFIAMPVFGEPSTASAGKLIVVPAGPASAIDRIRPFLVGVYVEQTRDATADMTLTLLPSTASAIVDFPDEPPSKANVLKLIGNVLIMTTMQQVAELLVFAEKTDLGTESIEKLLAALYPGGPQQHSKYASLMTSGEYHQRKAIVGTGSALALSKKVIGLAQSHKVPLKAYGVAIENLQKAHDVAGPESDIIGLYGAVRQESGLDFKA